MKPSSVPPIESMRARVRSPVFEIISMWRARAWTLVLRKGVLRPSLGTASRRALRSSAVQSLTIPCGIEGGDGGALIQPYTESAVNAWSPA